LPGIASADCHCHCTPPISSHSWTRTAQIFSKMPPSTHRWNQSWTVLLGPNRSGIWSHWQPLRIRKMIPLSIFLQFATRRPVGFLGQNSLRMGSIRRQSSSGISQIVARGFGRGLRRGMMMAPVATRRIEPSRRNIHQQRAFPMFSDDFYVTAKRAFPQMVDDLLAGTPACTRALLRSNQGRHY
jgi:hypothetical protein